MEIIETDSSIVIRADQKFPFKSILIDAGIVLALVWGIFGVMIIYFAHPSGQILPYFLAITLLLLVPLVAGILFRYSRHYYEIFINGEKRAILVKGYWHKQQASFDDIKEFQVNKYRFRKDRFLYRLDVILTSGNPIRLIQDVPDERSLRSFGRRMQNLIKRSGIRNESHS